MPVYCQLNRSSPDYQSVLNGSEKKVKNGEASLKVMNLSSQAKELKELLKINRSVH